MKFSIFYLMNYFKVKFKNIYSANEMNVPPRERPKDAFNNLFTLIIYYKTGIALYVYIRKKDKLALIKFSFD